MSDPGDCPGSAPTRGARQARDQTALPATFTDHGAVGQASSSSCRNCATAAKADERSETQESRSPRCPRFRQVIRQTRWRVLRGESRTPGKIVSLFEPWAQIIRKGKLHQPTEFGACVKVQEADGGIVTDVAVDDVRADALLLVPVVERHIKLFGRAPRLAATDRGFYSGRGEERIVEMGVRQPVIPRPGYRVPKRILYEKQRWFRRGRAWRAGGEARISRLKHAFGMKRSRYRGRPGLDRSICWAAIANNLVAIGRHRTRDA